MGSSGSTSAQTAFSQPVMVTAALVVAVFLVSNAHSSSKPRDRTSADLQVRGSLNAAMVSSYACMTVAAVVVAVFLISDPYLTPPRPDRQIEQQLKLRVEAR